MALDFAPKTFGKPTAAQSTATADRPKAEFWLNIGYTSEVQDAEGNQMFVSLPQGIPLDTQEHLKVSRNNDYGQFQAARNDLLDQLIEFAKQLKPGESTTINLELQLRRVNEEAPAIDPDKNMFARKLSFQ